MTLTVGCASKPPGEAVLRDRLDLVQARLEIDPRETVFEVRLEPDPNTGELRYTGVVEFEEQHKILHEQLGPAAAGVRLLPAPAEGGVFVRVKADSAFLYDAEQRPITQVESGDQLWLLLGSDDPVVGLSATGASQLLVRGMDGYVGRIDISAVSAALDEVDTRRSNNARRRIDELLQQAQSYLGTDYVWAGTTRAGLDCSGFVQRVYRTIGIHLPRDADQQSRVGMLVATRHDRRMLREGDLLFFLHPKRGTVYHVGISLGGDRYIEAAHGGVRITSLSPRDREFDRGRMAHFAWARRVID